MQQHHIIILRHGQSQWNQENRFTGWTDIPLTDTGRKEARQAAQALLRTNLRPDFFFTSYLKRAIHTLQIVADEMNLDWVPVIKDWHLNERHYGALQGWEKGEISRKYGDGQTHEWRRGYNFLPPLLSPSDSRWPGHDPRYASLTSTQIPLSESLCDTFRRVRCCWEEIIAPILHLHNTILIVAHGNSLRSLAKLLLNLTASEVEHLEIPTGRPWLLSADSRLNIIEHRYL